MISKFKTQEEREKKEQRAKKFFGFFVIFILMFSIASYALLSFRGNEEEGKYGKFNFVRIAEGWQTQIDEFFIITQFHPKEVEDINYEGTIEKGDFENIVYFVAKTNDEKKATDEINKNIMALKKSYACLPDDSESEECVNKTIKSCNDATYLQKIIVFMEKENLTEEDTSIIYENNCLTIAGKNKEELIRAADKIIFLIFNIIKNKK